jgi:CrcB protein
MVGGALGTLARYLVSGWTHKIVPGMFPWGTLVVNALGALLIGLLWGVFDQRDIGPNTRMFLFIGFLGGYTTFSTYALETMNLVHDGEMKLALINVLANNILAIGLVFGGYFLSKAAITNLS